MSRTKIEGANWHIKLADAVGSAAPGDVIEVASWHAAQLGHTAAQRMRGEGHGITFEVDGKPVAYSDADDPTDDGEAR
jgi:hypothetical protein